MPLQDILLSLSQSYSEYATLQLYMRDISDHLAIVYSVLGIDYDID